MFAYLSKRLPFPHRPKLTAVAWNTNEGWIALGGDKGLLKVLKLDTNRRGRSGPSNLTMNQALDGHQGEVRCIRWNSLKQRLTTSDEFGLIIVWQLENETWIEEMINNRKQSVVRDMQWTADGNKICICYEDGAVIVGSVEGARLWGRDLDLPLTLVQWSPDSRHILFGTKDSEVHLFDAEGNRISTVNLVATQGGPSSKLAAMSWFPRGARAASTAGGSGKAPPSLAIAFENGRVQVMRGVGDTSPVLIDTGMTTIDMKWNNQGTVLAIAGSRAPASAEGKQQHMVQFYSPDGKHLRHLRVSGSGVRSLSWEGNSLRLAMAIDSNIYFAKVCPSYDWAYFNNTLVYAFQKPDRAERCVTFWDHTTKERHVKYVRKLLRIDAGGDHCLFCTRTDDDFNQYILILCNAIGSPTDTKYTLVEPLFTAMTDRHIAVASESMIYVWQYRSGTKRPLVVKGTEGKQPKGREMVWCVDQTPSEQQSADYLEKAQFSAFSVKYPRTTDPICCLAASEDTLLVGRSSGVIVRYSLPRVNLLARYNVGVRPGRLYLNCNSTRMAVVTINSVLAVFDIDQNRANEAVKLPIRPERRDCWNLVWSKENPELFACMEKSRMYVFRGVHPEEPVASENHLCEFSDLCITAVQLDAVMLEPTSYILERPDDCVVRFPTKSLRDTKDLVQTTPLAEAYGFISDHPHPRLWQLLAEAALKQLNFSVADKAFVMCKDYQGIQFVKRLKLLTNKMQQKAEVEAYFERFKEAEDIYMAMDAKDKALALRMRLGDWFGVVRLADEIGPGNDEVLSKAWNNLGEYYADRQKWSKAKNYFLNAKNLERLAECAYRVDDFKTLGKILKTLPEGTPWLRSLGDRFQSVGLCKEAVSAYTKLGDHKAAIDCCVLLNQWDLAVSLAEEYKFGQIQGLLTKYATVLLQKNSTFEAIELYQKAGKFTESARLLSKLAKDSLQSKINCLRAKKLYVLAALDIEKYKEAKFDQKKLKGKTAKQTSQMTLQSLMDADREIGTESALEQPWHGALALHFYLLAQRQLYMGASSDAMHTALQLGRYEDVLNPKDIYSLIALTTYANRFFGQCSRAFIRLESLETLSEAERKKYKDLAMSIFISNRPEDPPTREAKCSICRAVCKPWDQQCSNCNANIPCCIVSGRPIFTSKYSSCKRCRQPIYTQLFRKFENCPLCHANLQTGSESSGGAARASGLSKQPILERGDRGAARGVANGGW